MSRYLLDKKSSYEDTIYLSLTPHLTADNLNYIIYTNHTYKFGALLGMNIANDAIYKYYNNVNNNKKVIDALIGVLPYETSKMEIGDNAEAISYPITVGMAMMFVVTYYASYLIMEKYVDPNLLLEEN